MERTQATVHAGLTFIGPLTLHFVGLAQYWEEEEEEEEESDQDLWLVHLIIYTFLWEYYVVAS